MGSLNRFVKSLVDCLEEISKLETIFKKWVKKKNDKKYRK